MAKDSIAPLTASQLGSLHRVSKGISFVILNEHREALLAVGLIVRGRPGTLELSDLAKHFIGSGG
jgi:hypothetical protein